MNRWLSLSFFILFLLGFPGELLAQEGYPERLKLERDEFAKELLESDAVLKSFEKEQIQQLNYFPIDTTWVLTARFKKKKGSIFEMPTTTERKPKYRRLGYLYFERDRIKFRLTVYQNIDLSKQKGYEDYVFIPFKDENSPELTYGGGRYLDLQMNGKSKSITVDFNRAYNPYCVYSIRYSCPLTPVENHVPLKINAGVMNPTMRD